MHESRFDRRRMLNMAGAYTGLGVIAGGDVRRACGNDESANVHPAIGFSPVHVSADRVTRTVVGLRPYRPSGFVVKSERQGEKTVIHNYGHGGAGVTLSWGTAVLAVEEAQQTGATTCGVLGCGVIGLSTARLLQRRGVEVTIYARDLPPRTTSNVAAAMWFPVSVYDNNKATDAFVRQFDRACHLSQRMFQDYLGDDYGVHWMNTYLLHRDPQAPLELPPTRELYPGIEIHQGESGYFGFPLAQQFHTMSIDPGIYLRALLRDFRLAGGKVVVRELTSRQEITRLPEPVIMNCTGLGARDLFDDRELTPVKGQLTVLLPQPEIDYAYAVGSEDKLLYMFPRRDGILLGGSAEAGNWSLEPNMQEQRRILEGHAAIAAAIGP